MSERDYQSLLFRKSLHQTDLERVNRDITRFSFGAAQPAPIPLDLMVMRATTEPGRPIYRMWDEWPEL